MNGAVVNFGSTALTTTFVSSTQLTATGTALASQAGNVPVTVTNPNPGSATSASINVLVTVPNSNIKVTVSPATAALVFDATQLFTATVTGTTNTAVTWSVNNELGGDSTIGTIDVNGNYTAPDILPSTEHGYHCGHQRRRSHEERHRHRFVYQSRSGSDFDHPVHDWHWRVSDFAEWHWIRKYLYRQLWRRSADR